MCVLCCYHSSGNIIPELKWLLISLSARSVHRPGTLRSVSIIIFLNRSATEIQARNFDFRTLDKKLTDTIVVYDRSESNNLKQS